MYRWCPGPESNRHASRRGILSPLRLPISPPGHGREDQDYDTNFAALRPVVKKLGSWWWMGLRCGWLGSDWDGKRFSRLLLGVLVLCLRIAAGAPDPKRKSRCVPFIYQYFLAITLACALISLIVVSPTYGDDYDD